jgi:outer membrane protein OmpA-like peptidoglycan-associated protein
MSRHLFMAIPVAVLALGGSTACATKKFVRTSVSEVNDKVDSLGRSVEDTQERTRRNEGRITEVDQKAAAAQSSADKANSAAAAADSAARAAGDSATTANNKVETLNKTVNRLVYEVVLSEDEGNFKFNNIDLPDEAKTRLDELISQMKADPKGAFFEIEGHTDNVGPNEVNERIGLERAEAVKRYLYEHHQIPLHKINVISYGEAKPVAENKTKEGRAQNRRIVVRVLV